MTSADSLPIFSSMSSDPDMLDLVEEFVDHLKKHVRSLEVAYASDDTAALARLAHQLKGASGGYGFDVIGQSAGELERSVKTADSAATVASQLEELVSLCRRATAEPAPQA